MFRARAIITGMFRRRLFAAAALTVVAFAALACAKQYGEADPAHEGGDDDDASQKSTPATTVTNDAGAPLDSGATPVDAGPAACTTCPCAVPTTTPPLPPSSTGTGAPCTATDLDLYLAGEGKPFDDAKAAMAAENALCAACVFTKESDATWGPVVKTDDGRRFVSFGTCYLAAGARPACADGWHAFEWCRQKVCNVCLEGENPSDCLNDARSTKCGAEFRDAENACSPGDFDIVQGPDCAGSGDVVKLLCGPRAH